jgi:glycosyltransferase involved in cell wall biosynthesis
LIIPAEYEKGLVSVVIPVYNGEDFLADAIASIVEQDYRPLEVIVVDDGSTDLTAGIAQRFPEVRYVYQPNQGHGSAKNTGIEKSRGEFLAFLDADDWWAPNKVKVQAEFLQAHPGVGYVLSHMKMILESGVQAPSWVKPEFLRQPVPAYIPSSFMVRRTILNQVGVFDPGYTAGNDSDWFFRAQDAGIQRALLPDVLLFRRIHEKNESGLRTKVLREEMLRLVRASVHRKRQAQA